MLNRILAAIFAAVVAYLICIVVGTLLIALRVDVTMIVGSLLKSFAGIISILVFLYYAFLTSLR